MSAYPIPLVPDQIVSLMQDATLRALNIDPAVVGENVAYGAVRKSWPVSGAPAWRIDEDVCFLRAVEEDNDYNRIREQAFTSADPANDSVVTSYTRMWRVSWVIYGPNAVDRARLIKSYLFKDASHDQLASSKLYMVTDTIAPRRVPEEGPGNQWWERVDFEADFYEAVTETNIVQTISSAEVKVYTENGLVEDINNTGG